MVTVIIGFTGQGKSTLACFISRRKDTRVIFDPRNQFHTTADIIPDPSELYELMDERYEIVVQPGRGQELSESFDATCAVVADWIEDNPLEEICLVADEGRLIGLDSKSYSLNFDWILRSAREGSPIDVIITCHRPVDVSTNIRAIANRLVFFRVMLPNDLQIIEDQCGPDVAEQVNVLLDRQFVVWNNSRQDYRKEIDSEKWKVVISETPTVGTMS